MIITNEQLMTIRLECLRLANGDVSIAKTMVEYIIADSAADIISDLRTQLANTNARLMDQTIGSRVATE